MRIPRSLISDEVIANKLIELQVKFFEEVVASHSTSTDFLIENNQEGYKKAETPEEQEKFITNIENLKLSQKNRIRNADYYKSQIEFLQKIFDQKDGEIEINTELKELIV